MKIITKTNINLTWFKRHFFHLDPDLLDASISNEVLSKVISDIFVKGTWKETRSGRLEQTERLIVKNIKNQSHDQNNYNLLDVGASDGSTTVNLVRELEKVITSPLNIYLADRYFYLHRYDKCGLSEYRTSCGLPVLLRFKNIGLRLPKSEHRYAFISNIIASLYLSFTSFRQQMTKTKTIPLLQKEILNNEIYNLFEFDCLNPVLPRGLKFNLVRCSNILNRAYFTDEQIKNFLQYISKFIIVGGVLVVSRNIENANDSSEIVSIWKKNKKQLELFESVNGGAEIDFILKDLN